MANRVWQCHPLWKILYGTFSKCRKVLQSAWSHFSHFFCHFCPNSFLWDSFCSGVIIDRAGLTWSGRFKQGVGKHGVTTFAWRPGWKNDVAARASADNVLASNCLMAFGCPSTRRGMQHLCDSTVAGPAARRHNVLASKCDYPRFWLSSRTRPVKHFGIFHYFWVFFRFVICRVVPRNANSWVQPLLLEGQKVNLSECFPFWPATNLPHVMVSACLIRAAPRMEWMKSFSTFSRIAFDKELHCAEGEPATLPDLRGKGSRKRVANKVPGPKWKQSW